VRDAGAEQGHGADGGRPPAQSVVPERPAPAFTQTVDTHGDFDDDVDVPPFMKR
jgi:hypothetical protein